jgi:polyisoprenoid-binding protein YceI
MNKVLLTAVLAGAACGVQAETAHYVIDPTHTFVMYEVGHFGTTTNRGRFSTLDGSVQLDREAKAGKVDITMDIGSINTGVDALNRHLQSKDFFNFARYPTGKFVADQMRFNGDKVSELGGTLTLLGQSHPVTLKAQRFNCYVNPMIRRETCGGDFETTISRSQWGINWGLTFGFEDQVRLLVQVEAIKTP